MIQHHIIFEDPAICVVILSHLHLRGSYDLEHTDLKRLLVVV